MSYETMNVKGDHKVVVVKYSSRSIFKILDGLDLEDTDVVEAWSVEYNKLHIYYTNGEEVEITPYLDFEDEDNSYKWFETEIDDDCYGVYEDVDDDDDDEKDKEEELEEEKISD